MGVDAVFIGSDVVDAAHDEELVGEGLEGSHGASEALGLEGRGDTEAEEEVEGADRDFGRLYGFTESHFFEKRKADSGAGKRTEEGSAVHEI